MEDDDDVELHKPETYMFKEPLHTLKLYRKHIGRSRNCEMTEELAALDGMSFDINTILVSRRKQKKIEIKATSDTKVHQVIQTFPPRTYNSEMAHSQQIWEITLHPAEGPK